MPRKPRMYLPGIPAHVVHRGNDRSACFFDEQDRQFYLTCLKEACRRYDVALHAFVLMTNHVHLLMTPGTERGISRVMQLVGNRYVQAVNKKYGRSGTLWEGRHKPSLIYAERYLLSCYLYIELNPVRAGMVAHPGHYPWSSYRHNAVGEPSRLIAEHPLFVSLGATPEKRRAAYRTLFGGGLDDEDLSHIRKAAVSSMPLGDDGFRARIEQRIGRDIGFMGRGRPSSRALRNG